MTTEEQQQIVSNLILDKTEFTYIAKNLNDTDIYNLIIVSIHSIQSSANEYNAIAKALLICMFFPHSN